MKTATNPPLGMDVMALAALLLASGAMHFVKPQSFEAMVPKQLPSRRALVYASGALEIVCGVGLFVPRTRRVAGLASAAVLVAVFPGNVTMTGRAKRRLDVDSGNAKKQGYLAATVARLPLQWPMIRTALRAGGVMR